MDGYNFVRLFIEKRLRKTSKNSDDLNLTLTGSDRHDCLCSILGIFQNKKRIKISREINRWSGMNALLNR